MFDSQYERLQTLGQGTYGTALLVRSRSSESEHLHVAKEIRISHLQEREQKAALAEAEVLWGLNVHPNIIAFERSFREGPYLYIVMEYADGGDLAAKISSRREAGKAFAEPEVMFIFLQLTLALMHIHGKKILHRDLKPMNVFLTKTGIVKLGDFGIAKVLESTTSGAMTLVGTPLYLSPEVCHNEPYGVASDLWSLGVVSYEVIALQPPFKATSLPALITKVCTSQPDVLPLHPYSNDLRRAVMSFLQKDPNKRPSLNSVIRTPFASRYMKELLAHTLTTGAGGCEDLTAMQPAAPQPTPGPKRSSSHPPLPPRPAAAGGMKASPYEAQLGGQRNGVNKQSGQDQRKDEVVQQYLQNRQIAMQAKQRARGSSSDLFGGSSPPQRSRVPVQKVPEPVPERLATVQQPAGVTSHQQRPARSQSAHVAPVSTQLQPSAEDAGENRVAMVRLKRQQEREEQDRLRKLELQKAREEALADRRIAQKRQAEQQRGALSHPVAEPHVMETTAVPASSPEPVKETTMYTPGSPPQDQHEQSTSVPLAVQEITMRPGDAATKYMLKEGEPASEALDDGKKSCEVEQLQEVLAAAVCLAEGSKIEGTAQDSKLEYSSTFVSSVFEDLSSEPREAQAAEKIASCSNQGLASESKQIESCAPMDSGEVKASPVRVESAVIKAAPVAEVMVPVVVERSEVDMAPVAQAGCDLHQQPKDINVDRSAVPAAPSTSSFDLPTVPAPDSSALTLDAKAPAPAPVLAVVQTPLSSPAPLEALIPPEVVAGDAGETVPMTSPSNTKTKGRCCSVM